MKILSVFGSVAQVIKRLELFLAENKFDIIKIDTRSNEITAERRFFFLWKDEIYLKIKPSKENIANIELKVNPSRDLPSEKDETKESNLQAKIYLYF